MTKTMAMGLMVGTLVLPLCFQVFAQQDFQEGQPVRFSVGITGVATDNRDATTEDKQENVDIYLRPRLEVSAGTETSFLDLFYEPALRYRTEPGDRQNETDLQHAFGLNVRHAFSERLRLRVSESLTLTDDPAVEDKGMILRGDQSYILNRIEAGLNYDMFRFSNLDLQVAHQIRRYEENDVAMLSDVDFLTARMQYRRSLTATLRALITGEFRTFAYAENPFLNRDFDSVVAAVGLENEFTLNTIGSISAGWQTREYKEDLLDSEGKPYVRAELSGRLNPDLRIGAVAGYGLRDSDAFPYASQEYLDVKGFADVNLTPKLLLRLASTYRISTYDPLGILLGGEETTLVGDAEAVFQISENASVMAGYRIEDIDSDPTVGASYTKNSARFGASLAF